MKQNEPLQEMIDFAKEQQKTMEAHMEEEKPKKGFFDKIGAMIDNVSANIKNNQEKTKQQDIGKAKYHAKEKLKEDDHEWIKEGYYKAIRTEQKRAMEMANMKHEMAKAKLQAQINKIKDSTRRKNKNE